MTFVKTSKGGFNLEQVTDWRMIDNYTLRIYLSGSEHITLKDDEAHRAFEILNGVCIFNTTVRSEDPNPIYDPATDDDLEELPF